MGENQRTWSTEKKETHHNGRKSGERGKEDSNHKERVRCKEKKNARTSTENPRIRKQMAENKIESMRTESMLPKKQIERSLSTSVLDGIHQKLLKNDLRTKSDAKDLKPSPKSTKRKNQLHHRTTQDTVCCVQTQTHKNLPEFIKIFQKKKNVLRAKSYIKNLKSKLKSPKNPNHIAKTKRHKLQSTRNKGKGENSR